MITDTSGSLFPVIYDLRDSLDIFFAHDRRYWQAKDFVRQTLGDWQRQTVMVAVALLLMGRDGVMYLALDFVVQEVLSQSVSFLRGYDK